MKNALRLALAGLALLASLTSSPKTAEALPVCDNLSGRSCSVPGKTVPCTWLDGASGHCFCDEGFRRWDCS